MKRAITAITFFDMVFVLLLSVSGSIGGVFGRIVYYLAFIVPIMLAFLFIRKNPDEDVKPRPPKIVPDVKSLGYTLPIIAPFIAAVFLISFLTSLLLNALGFSDSTDVSGHIASVMIKHAVLPAFFEEALFRFIPIMILAPYSKKNALVISSLLFAAVHCNLFQIPYALFASLILSSLAIATGSVIPCIALHFINNVTSVIFMRYSYLPNFNLIFFLTLGALSVLSVAFIAVRRKKYKEFFAELRKDKNHVEFTPPLVAFVAIALFTGVISLWMKL